MRAIHAVESGRWEIFFLCLVSVVLACRRRRQPSGPKALRSKSWTEPHAPETRSYLTEPKAALRRIVAHTHTHTSRGNRGRWAVPPRIRGLTTLTALNVDLTGPRQATNYMSAIGEYVHREDRRESL